MSAAPRRAQARRRLLRATLVHVPFDGWTRTAMGRAAADLDMAAGEARRLFPGGPGELLAFFVAEADRAMVAALAGRDLAAMRVRERIATAVRLRLEQHAPHREALRRALALQALPAAPGGAGSLWRTVDAMWRAAGDRSTDFSYYSRRALLAGVYLATLLYWLEDRSEGFEASWAFLDRRIDGVMGIAALRGRLARRLPDPSRLLRCALRRRTSGKAA